LSDSN